MKRLLLLICCLTLAGCATVAKQLNGSLQPPPGYGYAIVSMTALAFEPDASSIEAIYVPDGAPGRGGNIHASLLTDSVFGEAGSSPVEGKLALLTLQPGNYRFVEAIGYYPQEIAGWRTRQIIRMPMSAPFTVTAGRAVYLGEIRLDLSYRPELLLRDGRPRDFGHIRRVWHVEDLSPIDVRLLSPLTQ